MTPQFALDISYLVMFTCAKISAPFLLTAVVAGIVLNILQTVTSIRDQSVIFIPKVVVSGVVTALSLPWVIEQLISFINQVFQMFGQIVP